MERKLQEIGLTERESKVYLALLELGETTVGPIASKTKIQHAKIYPTLEKLIDKGLVSYIIKSKTKYFQATSPKNLLRLIKEKENLIKDIIPDLELKNKHSKEIQTARVYEGYDAIKSLFASLISSFEEHDFYYAFSFKTEYEVSSLASRFFRKIHLELQERKVDDKILSDSKVKERVKNNYKDIANVKIRFSTLHLPIGLVITPTQVINVIWGERPTAIEIISPQIARQYKEFFNEMWKLAKK
jgi:HTH-type transcriptional regulator, sugar sensing transcriptional regulator